MIKFTQRERNKKENIPKGHFLIVSITTDGGHELSVNFVEDQIPLFEQRHLDGMLEALKDAFYRTRPDLRPQ